MVDLVMQNVLRRGIEDSERFKGLNVQSWKEKYAAAWSILNGRHDIRSNASTQANVTSITRNMNEYCIAYGWKWYSNSGNNHWKDLLQGLNYGVLYDCHSIARALADLCQLFGYGQGAKNNVARVEKDNHIFVLPLILHMIGGEKGYRECGGHHVWSDHQLVEIDGHLYDAMLNVAGVPSYQKETTYVLWWAKEERDPKAWGGSKWIEVAPVGTRKRIIYRTPQAYTFKEVDIVPKSITKQNPFGDARTISYNPLLQWHK